MLVFKFICALILMRQTSELKDLQNKKRHSVTALAGCLCCWSHVCHKNGQKYRTALFHAMEAYRNRGLAPLILNLRTRWRWMVNFTPQPLYPRENTGIHWLRSGVGPIAGLDLFEEEKIYCPFHNSKPEPSSPCRVPIPTALSRVFVKVISDKN